MTLTVDVEGAEEQTENGEVPRNGREAKKTTCLACALNPLNKRTNGWFGEKNINGLITRRGSDHDITTGLKHPYQREMTLVILGTDELQWQEWPEIPRVTLRLELGGTI